jgi:hypothetical protein
MDHRQAGDPDLEGPEPRAGAGLSLSPGRGRASAADRAADDDTGARAGSTAVSGARVRGREARCVNAPTKSSAPLRGVGANVMVGTEPRRIDLTGAPVGDRPGLRRAEVSCRDPGLTISELPFDRAPHGEDHLTSALVWHGTDPSHDHRYPGL